MTDADLIMGKLDADNFAGGNHTARAAKIADALIAHIGDVLNMDAGEAAWGLAEVVDENMANAARVHAIENGEDLSEYVMIAFVVLHRYMQPAYARSWGLRVVLYPKELGLAQLLAFLCAPLALRQTDLVFMPMRAFEPATIKQLFVDMQDEATKFVRSCDGTAQIELEYKNIYALVPGKDGKFLSR